MGVSLMPLKEKTSRFHFPRLLSRIRNQLVNVVKLAEKHSRLRRSRELFLADIAHVRAFKLGRNDSSAIAFVPSGSTKPRIFGWTFQGFASVPGKDFAAFALASLEIQSPAIYAFLTSASRSGADPAHVRTFVFDFVVLLTVRLGVAFRIRQTAGFGIGGWAILLQTSRSFPQRIALASARAHVQTASVVTHLSPAIAQTVRTFSGAFLTDFRVISGRRVRRRADGVTLGTVIADEIVPRVVPICHFRTPNRGASQPGRIGPNQLGVFRASLVSSFGLIFPGKIPFAKSNFSIPPRNREFGKIRISINRYVLSNNEVIQMPLFPCIMGKQALFRVNLCLLL